jgi:transposase
MGRSELERLSKEELIELVLRLQRPPKTSRTSSKPPSTDRKQQRERSKPGGAKAGHDGHSRIISATPGEVGEHRPDRCSCCSAVLMRDLPGETISIHEQIELPEVAPRVTQHRRLAVRCPACGTRVIAPVPQAARAPPFGPRLHAVATYLKTYQTLSYERLQRPVADLFGLTVSQGGLMNRLAGRRAPLQPSATGPSRRCARPGSSPLMRRASGSRAPTPIIGGFAAPGRLSITPLRPEVPS